MIIGLSGHIKSGKSTAATLIKKYDSSFQEKYFAYKLKYIAAYLTGENIRDFETQEGKEGYLEEWGMTRRKILQQLGTESLRNHFHNQVWVKALFADIKPTDNVIISDTRFSNEADEIKQRGGKILRINRPFSLIYPEVWNTFISKMRYDGDKNEKVFTYWLNQHDNDLYNKITHPSEIGLDDYADFDYVIDNDGTIEEFEKKIQIFTTQLITNEN